VVIYCVAAHCRPGQTRRLIRRLLTDDPSCKVVLHYDQRHEPLDLREVADPRTTIVPKRPVPWGTFAMVQLFMDMMRTAVEDPGCSYVVLLSGQDYPLRSTRELGPELARFDVWAQAKALFGEGGAVSWPEGLRRYSYRWRHLANPGRLIRGLDRLIAKVPGVQLPSTPPPLPRLVHLRQRDQVWWGLRDRTGPGIPIYVGSSWMSLSRRAVLAVLSAPSEVLSFFRHVPCPDEACFQTILWNAEDLTFAPSHARFIRWDNKENPEILTTRDFGAMVQSGDHFARKFDDQVDAEVLDLLDSRLQGTDVTQEQTGAAT
jgi:Core-2/I-Branching enzyme